jgi:hypothetical protein
MLPMTINGPVVRNQRARLSKRFRNGLTSQIEPGES